MTTSPRRRRPLPPLRFASSFLAVSFALCAAAPVYADGVGEGRATAPVPVGPNVSQVAPDDPSSAGGLVYERARIKRTVSLDPAGGLENKWDALYSLQDASGGNQYGKRTAYFNWDDEFVYLAIEAPTPQQARFDLDLADDGWLRGADNLSLVVTPGEGDAAPTLTAQRFDMAQNRDQPVWAASQIPADAVKVRAGRTPQGGWAVTLAIPRTEAMGLKRTPGTTLGLRVDAAAPTLPPSTGETNLIPVRPMLRLALADKIDATGAGGLTVRVNLEGQRDITPGGEVKASIEVRNASDKPQRLTRVTLRGSLGGADWLDEQKFAGVDILPGKTYKRSTRTTVAPAAPFGALVIRGAAEVENGPTLAALTAFEKVEPYVLTLQVEEKPVPPGGENNMDARRTAILWLASRSNARITAQVKLNLPAGWQLESGTPQRSVALVADGQREGTRFKFIVPRTAAVGTHTLTATAEAGGRTYTASGTVTIVP